MNFISNQFPSAVLHEQHHNMLQYQLGSHNLSLAQLFAAMEEAKHHFFVEDYSISQTTLDQVIFILIDVLPYLFFVVLLLNACVHY